MSRSLSLPQLSIDTAAIAENTRHFAGLTHGRLMAVLKANAFGHGDVTSTVLEAGATWLGATTIDEALTLRNQTPKTPILSWLNTVDSDFEAALFGNIDVAVPSAAHLRAIAAVAALVGITARVHLHVDVGMNRDGAPREEWAALCDLAFDLERRGSIRVVGLMGHLSSADDPDASQNRIESAAFARAVRAARRRWLRPSELHLRATAATQTRTGSASEMSRIGAGLFGIDPSHTTTTLRPAMTLTAPVVSVKSVKAGAGVGYGHTQTAQHATTLALLPIGYGDGVPRAASGRAEVSLRGRRRPVLGLISMDQLVVDVGDDTIAPGEIATIFGPGDLAEPTVADWAGWAGTIEHEIVVGIGARVVRVTTGERNTSALQSAAKR